MTRLLPAAGVCRLDRFAAGEGHDPTGVGFDTGAGHDTMGIRSGCLLTRSDTVEGNDVASSPDRALGRGTTGRRVESVHLLAKSGIGEGRDVGQDDAGAREEVACPMSHRRRGGDPPHAASEERIRARWRSPSSLMEVDGDGSSAGVLASVARRSVELLHRAAS